MGTQNGIDNFFLAGNNYPDSPHSQGGMKFATQISPLLNSYFLTSESSERFQN